MAVDTANNTTHTATKRLPHDTNGDNPIPNANAVSGAPIQGVPGLQGIGIIVQGALETSNVNVTEELVNLIESQRLYEMNSKVISSVDQMLGQVIQQL